MSRSSPFLSILSALSILAGCLSASEPPVGPAADVASVLASLDAAVVDGHDHSATAEHPGSSWRLRDVWAEYVPLSGATRSPPSEFSIHDHYAFVATFEPSAGFVILDIAEPSAPTQVGRFDAGTAYVNDVEVSDDGRWAFVPTQPYETDRDPVEGPTGGGLPMAGDYGVQIVDLSDLAMPRLAGLYLSQDPSGYHRLDIEEIDGTTYVAGASYGLGRIDLLRFDETPVPRLVPISFYGDPRAAEPANACPRGCGPESYGVHDVTFGPDPLEGFPLVAVAHWRAGAQFLDASDPAAPRFLGNWEAFTEVLPGNVHNVEFGAIEGRRFAFVSPEYPGGHDRQGIVWIVDITDFGAPRLHGTWSLPGLHPYSTDEGIYVYSADRSVFRDGRLYLAHFHAGAIVLDVSTVEKAAAPELLGYLIPAAVEPVLYMGFTTNPLVYDVVPYGEHVLYSDLSGKFHVARWE
ncbi:MAG: LVIVD repeat-containing protein [Methanobacteriota archaeon]